MKTLVIGASTNPSRYSYKAIKLLRDHKHDVIALGLREGKVSDVIFETEFPHQQSIDTVTMYIGPRHQPNYYEDIIGLQPRRVIFNPGTENNELYEMLADHDIEVVEACTLVMLRTGVYEE